jgi:hypothetical protein
LIVGGNAINFCEVVTCTRNSMQIFCVLTYSMKLQLCAGMTSVAHTRAIALQAAIWVVFVQSKVAQLAAIASLTFHILLTRATRFTVDRQINSSNITRTWCTVGVTSKTWGTLITLWPPKPHMTFTNSCCL